MTLIIAIWVFAQLNAPWYIYLCLSLAWLWRLITNDYNLIKK